MKSTKLYFALFILSISTCFLNAQNKTHHKTHRIGSFTHISPANPDERFSILALFKDTTGKSNIRFSKVVMSSYTSKDSVLDHKRLTNKGIARFNANGEASSLVTIDSNGKAADSMSILYDHNFNKARVVSYNTKNPEGQLELSSDEYIARNTKQQIVLDSTWKKLNESSGDNTKGYSASIIRRSYDKAGNCTKYTSINDDDTTIEFSDYDNKNREIATRNYTRGKWNSEIKKYDDSSNIIEHITIYPADTGKTDYIYDHKNRVTSTTRYTNGKLNSKKTIVYTNDGGHTETEESNNAGNVSNSLFSNATDGSCETQHTVTTVYDKYDQEVSEVDKRVKGNESFTTTTLHKYQYTKDGSIISDTEINEEQSKWHTAKTMKVNLNKYDANGNTLEEVSMGGENLAVSSKKIYKYNDKNNPLEVDYYTSCSDKPDHTDFTIYYPDGVIIKQEIKSIGTYGKTINSYGKDSRVLEMTTAYTTFCYQVLIEYYK